MVSEDSGRYSSSDEYTEVASIVANAQLPSRLYKYQRFDAQTLANLKQASIWFSAPAQFNDPFDCALPVVNTDKLSDADFQQALDYVRQERPGLEARMCPDGVPTALFRKTVVNSVRTVYDERRKIQLEQRGVACFSEHSNDIMMWSHYADGHRGYCLEFDTAIEPFSKAMQVRYRDMFPSINPISLLVEDHTDGDNALLEAMVLTKATCWSYEREWRVLHMEAGKLFGYDYHALTGVYFGAAMPYAHKEIILLMLRDAPTQFHLMQRDEGGFRVLSTPVTYTPFPFDAREADGAEASRTRQ